MGFKVGRVFRLEGEFKDTDAEGAHVSLRSASMATVEELRDSDPRRDAEILAEHLVEWDLEDDDGPIPLTVDGIMRLEGPLVYLIIREWMKATRGITAPFDRRSAGGVPSPEVDSSAPSIPMDPL